MSAPADPRREELPDKDAGSAVLLAIRNAFTLGGSLVFTWSIALVIRMYLPRFLHTERFGTVNFSDAFTTTAFLVLNLGVENYTRKEIAVRPSHASDYYGGIFVLRVLLTLVIFGVMRFVFADRPEEVRDVVYVYALAQFFVIANTTLSAMLHSKGRVGGMSVLAVVTKVVWAAGVVWAMKANAGLWAYGAALLASESVETVALWWLARQHLGLAFRIDVPKTKAMLLTSVPYYLMALATAAYGKLDVSVLEFYHGSREVGLYGGASQISQLALLITPLIGWVLMPMFARAAARSREELYLQVSRSMELILTVAIPASLMINLGADLWIRLFFGAEYAPAAPALRVQAVMFVLTYVAIVYAMTMIMLERQWAFTWISVGGLVVNVALNMLIVRFSVRAFGVGGGGTGCALAMLGTEIFVVTCMVIATGGGAVTRSNVSFAAKCLGAYVVVAIAHLLMARLGYARLAVDAVLYVALILATGALRPRELITNVRQALQRPRSSA
jgi:O-antigen/teichoic acid export membrane protein